MYIDFKITTWERVEFPDELEDKVIGMVKSGEIKTANDLFEDEELEDEVSLIGVIPETEHYMTLQENNGEATIEICVKGNGIPLFKNEVK